MGYAFDQLSSPAIIAHRGASSQAPENTLAAFDLALKLHADAIEFDVRLTKDKHVIAFHDLTLQRTTNGKGKVRNKTLAELKSLYAGTFFDPSFQGQRIPTLEEIFEKFGNRTFYHIEIKNFFQPFNKLTEKVISLIKKYNLQSLVTISSFNPIALIQVNHLLPSLDKGLLLQYPQTLSFVHKGLSNFVTLDSLHIPVEKVTKGIINNIHDMDQKILVYTVNDPKLIRKLVLWGVDGIFTDVPITARNALMAEE
ncbi:MAG: glycerophosphodiester phosphodiesterase family protein [Anaerolineales bacterium]